MRRIVVEGRYTYETALDVDVGDEVILPDRGIGQWIGTVTALTSDHRGTCRRVIGLARRRAEVEEREIARQAIRIGGWRPGESFEVRRDGLTLSATVVEVNAHGRPTHVEVDSDPPSSVYLGSAAAWRDVAAGIG